MGRGLARAVIQGECHTAKQGDEETKQMIRALDRGSCGARQALWDAKGDESRVTAASAGCTRRVSLCKRDCTR